ncbi:hypothetical protein [Neomegalonema perideroedes]|uniref:hypothetical protein n=1 Tax=Neomegalonema perideroedes TaxID=217219 RepID=UPI000362AE83|nr:hypothetical protein [Neomegalonema perideroedes]
MTAPADRRLRAPPRYGEEAALWAPVLGSGERLLWTGEPARGLKWRGEDWFHLPFGLVFFAFALVWTGLAWYGGGGIMTLWGVPFVVVGFQIAIGRFFTDARRRARTRYALTDRRALIVEDGRRPQFGSIPIASGTGVEIRSGPLSTIMFKSPAEFTVLNGSKTINMRQGGYGFEFIEEGESVYRLILDIQQGRAL